MRALRLETMMVMVMVMSFGPDTRADNFKRNIGGVIQVFPAIGRIIQRRCVHVVNGRLFVLGINWSIGQDGNPWRILGNDSRLLLVLIVRLSVHWRGAVSWRSRRCRGPASFTQHAMEPVPHANQFTPNVGIQPSIQDGIGRGGGHGDQVTDRKGQIQVLWLHLDFFDGIKIGIQIEQIPGQPTSTSNQLINKQSIKRIGSSMDLIDLTSWWQITLKRSSAPSWRDCSSRE